MRIFLDDNPRRTKAIKNRIDVIDVETATECINTISHMIDRDTVIQTLFLDHDLGGQHFQDSSEQNCGMEVVRWLEAHFIEAYIEQIIVHSHNIKAAEIMVDKLAQVGYNVMYVPFRILENITKD